MANESLNRIKVYKTEEGFQASCDSPKGPASVVSDSKDGALELLKAEVENKLHLAWPEVAEVIVGVEGSAPAVEEWPSKEKEAKPAPKKEEKLESEPARNITPEAPKKSKPKKVSGK